MIHGFKNIYYIEMNDYTYLLEKIRIENKLPTHKQYEERAASHRRHEMSIKHHNAAVE